MWLDADCVNLLCVLVWDLFCLGLLMLFTCLYYGYLLVSYCVGGFKLFCSVGCYCCGYLFTWCVCVCCMLVYGLFCGFAALLFWFLIVIIWLFALWCWFSVEFGFIRFCVCYCILIVLLASFLVVMVIFTVCWLHRLFWWLFNLLFDYCLGEFTVWFDCAYLICCVTGCFVLCCLFCLFGLVILWFCCLLLSLLTLFD